MPPGGAAAIGPREEAREWRVSDLAHAGFADLVPDGVLGDPSRFVIRGRAALMDVSDVWITCEAVLPSELETWKARKATGPGRGPRLIEAVFDAQGLKIYTFEESLARCKKAPKPSSWKSEGPEASPEFFSSLRAMGLNIETYHAQWVRASGAAAGSSASRRHRLLSDLLRTAQQVDQLDVLNCAFCGARGAGDAPDGGRCAEEPEGAGLREPRAHAHDGPRRDRLGDPLVLRALERGGHAGRGTDAQAVQAVEGGVHGAVQAEEQGGGEQA